MTKETKPKDQSATTSRSARASRIGYQTRSPHGDKHAQPSRPNSFEKFNKKEAKRKLAITAKGRTKHLANSLEDATYIVFDIETTGGNPERNGITEIMAIKVKNGQEVGRFYSLVNPKIKVPPIVRKMTGITNEMLEGEPLIEEVMPKFVHFAADHILVSHNTIGDIKFLRHFSALTCGEMMANYYLCTHLLTEKLYPEMPDKSLKGLAKNLKFKTRGDFHRAEADAYVTWELFKMIQNGLRAEQISTVAEAIRHQADFESAMRLGWGVSAEKIGELPHDPGIFYLHNKKGELTFLASVKNLHAEVRNLSGSTLIPKQLSKIVLQSYDVTYENHSCLFSASLMEAKHLAKYDLGYDPAEWHLRVSSFLYFKKVSAHSHRLGIGLLSEGVYWAQGPIKNYQIATDLLQEIGDLLAVKGARRHIDLNALQARAVLNYLAPLKNSKLKNILDKVFNMLPKQRREMAQMDRLNQAFNQAHLPKEFGTLANESGVIGLSRPDTDQWALYTLGCGVPELKELIRGELTKETLKKEGAKWLKYVKAYKRQFFVKPLNSLQAHSANRMLWWLIQNSKKPAFLFLTLDEMVRSTKK